jgi:hypothetical protein
VAHHFFGLENNNNLCICHAFAQANEHTLNTTRKGKERKGKNRPLNTTQGSSYYFKSCGTASQFLFLLYNKKGT